MLKMRARGRVVLAAGFVVVAAGSAVGALSTSGTASNGPQLTDAQTQAVADAFGVSPDEVATLPQEKVDRVVAGLPGQASSDAAVAKSRALSSGTANTGPDRVVDDPDIVLSGVISGGETVPGAPVDDYEINTMSATQMPGGNWRFVYAGSAQSDHSQPVLFIRITNPVQTSNVGRVVQVPVAAANGALHLTQVDPDATVELVDGSGYQFTVHPGDDRLTTR